MIDRLMGAGRWLVLPLGLLLVAQWPLRDLVGAYSRQANDAAQCLFALYVALAVTQATRRGAHLAAHSPAHRLPAAARRRLARLGAAVMVAPWAAFVVVSGWPSTWQSVRGLEAFPDTYDPGYFIVRLSAMVLAALALVQAVRDAVVGER
ncbi:MAG: TRAP transporter small permease subunit [Actinomycetota bacterium]